VEVALRPLQDQTLVLGATIPEAASVRFGKSRDALRVPVALDQRGRCWGDSTCTTGTAVSAPWTAATTDGSSSCHRRAPAATRDWIAA
jgi:hypothetical protein